MEIATAGAMILGLHNKQFFTISAQVLPEALLFTDKPEGFEVLCELVMSGNLSDAKQIIVICENYWDSLLEWCALHGYQIECSKVIPW